MRVYVLVYGTVVRTKEANLAMDALQELRRRDCNGHVRFRLGEARVDPETFCRVFERFSRGTYFEDTAVEVETVEPVFACGCGYRRCVRQQAYLDDPMCPRCQDRMEMEQGHEFEIVEPRA